MFVNIIVQSVVHIVSKILLKLDNNYIGIREGSFKILLPLLGSLRAVIRLVFFLQCKASFIPSRVFFMFVLWCLKQS